MTDQREVEIRRRLDRLSGEMHGAFAELEAQGFDLRTICYCAVDTALSRMHRKATMRETRKWCEAVALVMADQMKRRSALMRDLDQMALN